MLAFLVAVFLVVSPLEPDNKQHIVIRYQMPSMEMCQLYATRFPEAVSYNFGSFKVLESATACMSGESFQGKPL